MPAWALPAVDEEMNQLYTTSSPYKVSIYQKFQIHYIIEYK